MLSEESIRWWQSLTTLEVGELATRDAVAILPLSAIEQHGPHLPLSTDLDIGLGILAAAYRILPKDFPAFALPPQAVGASREHTRFGGTLSLETELLVGAIEAAGDALARDGVRRLVLSNSHGGNWHAMHEAALRLREAHDMLVVKASWFRSPKPAELDLPEAELKHGLHGGALETAMMMHLKPEHVRPDKITTGRSLGQDLEKTMLRLGPEGTASFAWLAGDLNPDGVIGDARLADAALGAKLVTHYGTVLAEVILDTRAFPLDRLS
jgi:creatinine amidohydrolase